MVWKCKYCPFSCEKRAQLFKHYRLKHGGYTRTEPFPCLHQECLCTFKSLNALKVHLSRIHTKTPDQQQSTDIPTKFSCLSCGFTESCSESDFFTHLHRAHLKVNHKVRCPYEDCNFESSVYSTFKAHKSKVHKQQISKRFKSEIVGDNIISHDSNASQEQMSDADDIEDTEELNEVTECDLHDLEKQLEHNLASLLLKMHTVLHIPESAVQDVIEQLCQINKLSQPLVQHRVRGILNKYCADMDETVIKEIISAVSESNMMTHCSKDGPLGTAKKRAAYVRREFPLVNPIEYVVEKGKKTLAYVPIVPMLQKLLNKTDVLDKAMSEKVHVPQEFRSYADGQYFTENPFFAKDEFTIALGLYIDDFEVANPLGTSKLKHKMCAVYWVIANIPSKYRSTLSSIQLALLCNTSTVKECGYAKVFQPLIYDLKLLEQNGVYLEQLGASVKGTVLYVAADNLAAHSLAGFLESFTVDKFCRFCLASSRDTQQQEVCSGFFQLRDKESHDRQVQDIREDPGMTRAYGVKGACPLTENLEHFHVVSGYPPDILHDILEGIVPVELSLCLTDLIGKTYFTLDMLNQAIRCFKYSFSDKTDRPQVIGKGFSSKGTIGGNGHENWCLIRLLPFLIGHCVPEGDNTWEILMLLKDITELAVAPKHTEETLNFLDCKIAEHRRLLQSTFPEFRLRPKHHFVEHYPQLVRKFGPLSEVWTMRFEGKHKFFKRVIRTAQNFKNVAMTLATKHQKAVSYHLDCSSFFRPSVEMSKVTPVLLATFPHSVQTAIAQNFTTPESVLEVASVSVDGIKYHPGMILSSGSCSGLPAFVQIHKIVAVNVEILFVCHKLAAWYREHLRSYQLHCDSVTSMCVLKMSDLNDVLPLSAYMVQGELMVTLRRFVIC